MNNKCFITSHIRVKYGLDRILAFGLLLLLLPVFLVIILAIYLKEEGTIFFNQIRPGLNEKPFKMYKFRTMLELRDKGGLMFPDKKRLTKLGQFLRKTSLDELPEILNILKGEMSLVGPRPLLEDYLPLYNERQRKRHMMKPGMTGWAQVNGRNLISWAEKFEFDVWYIENWSLWLDMKILFLSFLNILKREGISANGYATMPKFDGNK